MGLKDMLVRLRGVFGSSGMAGTPVSPDEKELEVYMERERKQRVRKVLDHYRKKERYEFLQHNPLQETFNKSPLLQTPRRTGELSNRQKKSLRKHSNMLKQGNLFMKE